MENKKVASVLAPSFLPATCVLEMTYKCNHKCLFCSCPWEAPKSRFKKKKELSVKQWKSIISKIVEMGVLNIAFSGGEPLMKKGIYTLIEHAANQTAKYIETENDSLVTTYKPPKIYLISNGGIMDDEALDICAKHKVHLSMSLPGLRTYQYHTANGDSPQRILYWFEKAHKKGVSTTVNITVTKKNIFELYETLSSALIAGADTLLMNRFLPGGRGLYNKDDLFLNVDQTNEMLDIADEVLTKANRKGNLGTELPKCLIKKGKDNYKNLEIGTKCSAAIDFFTIDPSGYIRACNHSEHRLQHFSDIEKLKHNSYWKRFIMKDYHPEICKVCVQKFNCDGGCREAAHIAGGDLNAQDPLFAYC